MLLRLQKAVLHVPACPGSGWWMSWLSGCSLSNTSVQHDACLSTCLTMKDTHVHKHAECLLSLVNCTVAHRLGCPSTQRAAGSSVPLGIQKPNPLSGTEPKGQVTTRHYYTVCTANEHTQQFSRSKAMCELNFAPWRQIRATDRVKESQCVQSNILYFQLLKWNIFNLNIFLRCLI